MHVLWFWGQRASRKSHRPQELEFIIHPDGRVEERVRGIKGMDCQSVTAEIKKVATIEVLLRMYRTNDRHFNHIHLSACWVSLGRLLR